MSRWKRRSAAAPRLPEPIDSASLDRRCAGLAAAARAAAGRLPDGPVRQAETVLAQVAQRRRFSDDLTVVALAGPTGAGKSTLFNALVGQEVARVAVTRPTTDRPTAALWTSPQSAGALLDWLGVTSWHVVGGTGSAEAGSAEAGSAEAGSAEAGPAETGPAQPKAPEPTEPELTERELTEPELTDLTGLVLLDLPDHDSTAATHREQVDLLVARVDIMVWVLDPQKYADALVHDAYLAQFARHEDLTIVLLNQVDRLEPADARAAREHLGALVAADGLPSTQVLGVSARTGEGIEEVRGLLAAAVQEGRAALRRLAADVAAAADGLQDAAADTGDPVATVPASGTQPLSAALADAAGVGLVETAVRDSVRRSGARATGWPVVRWTHRLRRDPAARLRLGRPGVDPALLRTSMPSASPVALAGASTAARQYADLASSGAPPSWVRSTRAVAVSAAASIGPHLDAAVAHADVGAPRAPRWWALIGLLQWLLLACAAVGAAWLLGMVALGALAIPTPDPPTVGGLPVPTVLLLGGSVLGIVLAALARAATRITARRAAARARAVVTDQVTRVAHERVVDPVSAELTTLSEFRAGLAAAVGA